MQWLWSAQINNAQAQKLLLQVVLQYTVAAICLATNYLQSIAVQVQSKERQK